jgi:hypothetical protein
MKSYVLLSTAAVPILSLVGLYLLDRKHHDDALTRLQAQVANLQGPAGPTERATEAPISVALRQFVAAAPTAAFVPPSPTASPKVLVPESAEIRDNLQSWFEADRGAARDWGGQAPRAVTERLHSLLPEGSTLQSFECRATMCRIETTHGSFGAYSKFARSAFTDSPTKLWNAPSFLTRLNKGAAPGEPFVMVTYIAQPGQSLPPEPQE